MIDDEPVTSGSRTSRTDGPAALRRTVTLFSAARVRVTGGTRGFKGVTVFGEVIVSATRGRDCFPDCPQHRSR